MLLVMLAEQVATIVVPVWRPHDRMDMVSGGLKVVPYRSRQMVELNQDHRTVHTVIKWASLS